MFIQESDKLLYHMCTEHDLETNVYKLKGDFSWDLFDFVQMKMEEKV